MSSEFKTATFVQFEYVGIETGVGEHSMVSWAMYRCKMCKQLITVRSGPHLDSRIMDKLEEHHEVMHVTPKDKPIPSMWAGDCVVM